MGLRRVGQGVGATEPYAQYVFGYRAEDLVRAPEHLGAGTDEVRQHRPGHEQRTQFGETLQIERRHSAARGSEQRERTQRPKRGEARLESGRTDAVVDGGDTFAARQFPDTTGEIV